jgi:hypothetical protein
MVAVNVTKLPLQIAGVVVVIAMVGAAVGFTFIEMTLLVTLALIAHDASVVSVHFTISLSAKLLSV